MPFQLSFHHLDALLMTSEMACISEILRTAWHRVGAQ